MPSNKKSNKKQLTVPVVLGIAFFLGIAASPPAITASEVVAAPSRSYHTYEVWVKDCHGCWECVYEGGYADACRVCSRLQQKGYMAKVTRAS